VEALICAPRRYIPPAEAPTGGSSISFSLFESSNVEASNPNLCKVELQRVVRAQADVEPCLEKVGQRVPLVREEERIVAQRAHGDANLLEVK